MGLDIVAYDKLNNKINLYEITEKVHREVFSKEYWRSYKYLRKLQDYYSTNETFSISELKGLIEELILYMQFLSKDTQVEINWIIEVLRDDRVFKVHISGD